MEEDWHGSVLPMGRPSPLATLLTREGGDGSLLLWNTSSQKSRDGDGYTDGWREVAAGKGGGRAGGRLKSRLGACGHEVRRRGLERGAACPRVFATIRL